MNVLSDLGFRLGIPRCTELSVAVAGASMHCYCHHSQRVQGFQRKGQFAAPTRHALLIITTLTAKMALSMRSNMSLARKQATVGKTPLLLSVTPSNGTSSNNHVLLTNFALLYAARPRVAPRAAVVVKAE